MPRSLIIVESPTKVRTIQKYLGPEFEVKASVGHIKDLPKKTLGIDIDNNFEPIYEVISEKKKVISELKKAAKKAAKKRTAKRRAKKASPAKKATRRTARKRTTKKR